MASRGATAVTRGPSHHWNPALGRVGGHRWCDERATALPGNDQPSLAQHLHRVPNRLVCDAVLLSKRALSRQLVLDLADLDPRRDVIRDLHVGKVRAKRVNDRHVINVGAPLAI